MSGDSLRHYQSFFYDSSRWSGFGFRKDDIVIATPPKCGTTWMQRICALLVFGTPALEQPLTRVSPWIDILVRSRADIVADLEAQRHRRFIKTHTPLDGIPWDPRVTYLVVGRDPRDVALSWDNHMLNGNASAFFKARAAAVGNEDIAGLLAGGLPALPESERERFWMWVNDPTPAVDSGSSLLSLLHHLYSFWQVRERENIVLLHYADLERDLGARMRDLAASLDIEIPEERWPALLEAATFADMKRHADRMAPDVTESVWKDNARFFNSGTSGQWRRLFEPGDKARYEARVRELAEPEFAAWAHHGSALGAGNR